MRCLLGVLVSLLVLNGCAHVRTYDHFDDRELRTFEEQTVGSEWTYATAVTVNEGSPVVAEVSATRSHQCETATHRVVQRTRLIDRTPERPGWTWAFGIAGTLGAASLTTGIALEASGMPFTTSMLRAPGLPMYGTETRLEPPLYLAVAGAALLPFLLVALGEGIRSTGSSEDLGEQDLIDRVATDCQTEPAAGATVRVMSGDELVVEGTTDSAGVVRITIPEPTNVQADLQFSIDGVPVEGSETLRARFAELQRSRNAAAEAANMERRRMEVFAMLDQEIVNGRCSAESQADLERVFQHAVQYAHLMSTGHSTELWDLVSHSFVVVDNTGEMFAVRPGLRGEHHLVVVGIAPPQLELQDGTGYAVTEGSSASFLGTGDSHTVGRVIRSSTGERLTARVTGRGCALMMLFSVFR